MTKFSTVLGLGFMIVGALALMTAIAPYERFGLRYSWVNTLAYLFGIRGMRIISTIVGVLLILFGALGVFKPSI